METSDVGQMVLRFFDALEEHYGEQVEFDDVLVIAAHRVGDDATVAYRTTTNFRHVNLGLLAECKALMLETKEDE